MMIRNKKGLGTGLLGIPERSGCGEYSALTQGLSKLIPSDKKGMLDVLPKWSLKRWPFGQPYQRLYKTLAVYHQSVTYDLGSQKSP